MTEAGHRITGKIILGLWTLAWILLAIITIIEMANRHTETLRFIEAGYNKVSHWHGDSWVQGGVE